MTLYEKHGSENKLVFQFFFGIYSHHEMETLAQNYYAGRHLDSIE